MNKIKCNTPNCETIIHHEEKTGMLICKSCGDKVTIMDLENELDICSKCGLIELPEDYPYHKCEQCMQYDLRHDK
jgi:hypothetical protein